MDKGTILVVEDEPNIADLVDLYLSRDGFRVREEGDRRGRPRRDPRPAAAPRRARRRAPGRRRARGVPAHPRDERAPGDLPHRARRRGRPRPRPRARRRRLPHEAVRARGARRAGEGGAAAHRRRAGRRRWSRWAAWSSTSAGARSASTTTPVDFTTKEFELLRFLAERPGLAMSRHQILDAVWGHGWYGDERTVDVHIAQVRKKVGDACVIATVRGRRLPPRAGRRVTA